MRKTEVLIECDCCGREIALIAVHGGVDSDLCMNCYREIYEDDDSEAA